jgi:hypothetical protein
MTDRTEGVIRIGDWYQGPTGCGQGGWSAHRFVRELGRPASVAIKAPIPLETDLVVEASPEGRPRLVTADGTTIMVAGDVTETFPTTDPVSIETAREARSRFGEIATEHPVPYCFSCGIQHDSMKVHAAPLGDDRFATDWTVPDWAVGADGHVDEGVLWAAIDCCAAWWVGYSRDQRVAFTAQFVTEVLYPLEPGATYALVAWSGDRDPEWDGRKRHAASAAFDAHGRCVARSASFWVSVPTP